MRERLRLILMVSVFVLSYYLAFEHPRLKEAILSAFLLLQDCARHRILCLVLAFFIARAISLFLSKEAVLKYFGPAANKLLSYSVAWVSGDPGGLLLHGAVASCGDLPDGGGNRPRLCLAIFGPCHKILAIVLTAKVRGWKIGLARTVRSVPGS